MNERVCAYCGGVFAEVGDNWYRVDRMHADRVGEGPLAFCCAFEAARWLMVQDEIGPPTKILAKGIRDDEQQAQAQMPGAKLRAHGGAEPPDVRRPLVDHPTRAPRASVGGLPVWQF